MEGFWHKALVVGSVSLWRRLLASGGAYWPLAFEGGVGGGGAGEGAQTKDRPTPVGGGGVY